MTQSHSQTGAAHPGVESYAALAGELAIQGGTTGVSISVPARTVVSLALATTAPGHAIAQSSVRLRVMELHDGTLGKELCSGGMLVSSAEAVVTGLAGQEAHNQANVISCRWRRDTTVAARAVVIFEETGYAVVHGIGAAHALLDTMIDLVDVASERP